MSHSALHSKTHSVCVLGSLHQRSLNLAFLGLLTFLLLDHGTFSGTFAACLGILLLPVDQLISGKLPDGLFISNSR